MNNFDKVFFKKYVPVWSKIKWIIHEHFFMIFDKIIVKLILLVIIPSFFYYQSNLLSSNIPFIFLEIYLIIMFFIIIYDIFNWYNDVWIITDSWVVDLDWELFNTSTISVKYSSIEWIEVEQEWIINNFIWKWNLIINRVWTWAFRLDNACCPFSAVDKIEKYSREVGINEDIEDKEAWEFDMIMDALWWVVRDYLEKWWEKEEDIEKKKEFDEKLEKIKNEKWTIDLR